MPYRERTLSIGDEMGLGKDQPLDAKILTPIGWTTMGQIQVGDLAIGHDGQPYPITGTYPQGLQKVYRITFQDGSSTECGKNHLWEVNTPLRNFRNQPPKILTLSKILEMGVSRSNKRVHHIRLCSPTNFKIHNQHDIAPYLLGYILGNSGLSSGTVRISIPDQETIERLNGLLPQGYHLSHQAAYDYLVIRDKRSTRPNDVRLMLDRLGLMGTKSCDKHIPQEYLWGRVELRIELLQGLIDSDGHVRPLDGNIEYSTSSPTLAKDVQQLIWSLGGTAKIRPKKTKCLDSYRMSVILPDEIDPCQLERKKIHRRLRPKYPPYRVIAKIEEVGFKQTKCIKIDSPDNLYITDDFIVTHNTVEALGTCNSLSPESILVVCPATLVLNWKRRAE